MNRGTIWNRVKVSETVGGMDADVEPPRMGSWRVSEAFTRFLMNFPFYEHRASKNCLAIDGHLLCI
jgi:hypothetical protein